MPLPLSDDDLWSAWERVRENEGCAGADGVTVHAFGERAPRRLADLLERAKTGTYRAFPLLKIVVEKGGGRTLGGNRVGGNWAGHARPLLGVENPGAGALPGPSVPNGRQTGRSAPPARTPPVPGVPEPGQGRKTGAGAGAPSRSESPACRAAVPGGILPAGGCPQESGHGRPEAHSTGADRGAAGPIQQTRRAAPLKTRTLLVPAVRDRVLQTAVARHLSRSFEEEFLECSYGYRPGRSVDRAIARIRKCRELGYVFVVDADIASFFDRVSHDALLERLASRKPGEEILGLVRQWVRGAMWDGQRIHAIHEGLPQGSPISPLLANFFLEDFDRELEKSGRKLVRYCDDFVVLARTREDAEQALVESESRLAALHLDLNREKTQIVDFEHGFRFLGALFQGEGIWVPWKHERAKGKILFMARPLPPAMRTRFEEMAPPENTMSAAFRRAGGAEGAPRPEPERKGEPVSYLYLVEQGAVLRKAGDRFLVEKEDEVLLDLPYHKLETVLLFGNIQVTTQAMAELLEKGVNLSLFSRQGNYRGSLAPPRGRNIELRIAQFDLYRDAARALELARGQVRAKVANALATLAGYRKRKEVSEAFEGKRGQIAEALAGAETAGNVAALDGFEGTAARLYFECVMEFNGSEMTWQGRLKHPAPDPLNALLSLTYTLLTQEIAALLEGAGLDPYLGYLHQVDYGRPSLALDLVEPFRNPVADRLVLTLANRRVIEAEDFEGGGERPGVFLKPKALKRYFEQYERWMLGSGTAPGAPEGGPPARFRPRDRLRMEVEGLAAALRGGAPFAPFRYGEEGDGKEGECSTSSVTI